MHLCQKRPSIEVNKRPAIIDVQTTKWTKNIPSSKSIFPVDELNNFMPKQFNAKTSTALTAKHWSSTHFYPTRFSRNVLSGYPHGSRRSHTYIHTYMLERALLLWCVLLLECVLFERWLQGFPQSTLLSHRWRWTCRSIDALSVWCRVQGVRFRAYDLGFPRSRGLRCWQPVGLGFRV